MRYLFGSYYDLDAPPKTWMQSYALGKCMQNPGDLVYAMGLMDILRTDPSVEFVPTGYVRYAGRLPLSLREVNETCSALILPFADHFRESSSEMLNRYTDLVRKVKIPVLVPCIGVRTDCVSPKADTVAKRFVSAVLDKSSVVGLRGETTARYLEKLGFVRNRHFVVVGCPSLYGAGPELPALTWPDNPCSCAFGLNHRAGETVNRFIFDSAQKVPNRRFVTQDDREFIRFFLSGHIRLDGTEQNAWYRKMVISTIQDESFRYYFNLNSWKRCLRSVDCSISCRIHGTILALLCGVPATIVPFEYRTRELAEYHAIPIVDPDEICPGDTVAKFADRFDFTITRQRHRENFALFLDFLHRNGLKTAFDSESGVHPAPDADVFAKDIPCETMKPLDVVSPFVRAWRNVIWNALWCRRRFRRRFPSGIPVA